MTTDIKYVVMEKGFEYNDETYDPQEGGTPVELYDTKEEAQEAAVLLSGLRIIDESDVFSYGNNGAFRDPEAAQKVLDSLPAGGTIYSYDPLTQKNTFANRTSNSAEDYWDISFSRKLTLEEALKLFQYFDTDLYEVMPVTVQPTVKYTLQTGKTLENIGFQNV